MDKTVALLVDFVHSRLPSVFTESTLAAARQRIVDTVGCALGGIDTDVARSARSLALSVEGGSVVWGTDTRSTPEDAAFANGVAVRYLDFNDTYRKLDGSHPSDNLAALMALGELKNADGATVLRAVVASYETQSRFADVAPFNSLGWDQPVAGVVGAAVGASVILGLDREQTAHAISLAIVPNMAMHQTRCGELSHWKGCAGSMGGRQGIHAARLAAAGIEGPGLPFDGVNGVWAQVGGIYEPTGLGEGVWAVQQTNVKTWPVRDSCQLAVDTARELRQKIGSETIESLRIETYASAHKGAVEDPELWAPKTRETADHSMLISAALGLIDDGVFPSSFADGRFLDDDVLGLIGRTTVDIVDEFNSMAPAVRNNRITATLASGAVVSAHGVLTQADIERGQSDDQVSDKFRELAADSVFDAQGTEDLLNALWSIDKAERISDITNLLAVPSAS